MQANPVKPGWSGRPNYGNQQATESCVAVGFQLPRDADNAFSTASETQAINPFCFCGGGRRTKPKTKGMPGTNPLLLERRNMLFLGGQTLPYRQLNSAIKPKNPWKGESYNAGFLYSRTE